MKLTGNTILITGGSSGIGLSLATTFYELGNKVIVAARDLQKLKTLKEQFPLMEMIPCDLTRQSDIDALMVVIEQQFPELNVLFNNAAIQYNYDFLTEHSVINKVDYEIAANLTATIKLCGLLLPILLRNKNSAIINISSGLAITPKKSAPVYCATKAAIHSFTVALRYQLEGTGVRVFEILPPIVATPMTEGRGKSKISPSELVKEFLPGFRRDKEEIYIGKSKLLWLVNRISPRLAATIMKNG